MSKRTRTKDELKRLSSEIMNAWKPFLISTLDHQLCTDVQAQGGDVYKGAKSNYECFVQKLRQVMLKDNYKDTNHA